MVSTLLVIEIDAMMQMGVVSIFNISIFLCIRCTQFNEFCLPFRRFYLDFVLIDLFVVHNFYRFIASILILKTFVAHQNAKGSFIYWIQNIRKLDLLCYKNVFCLIFNFFSPFNFLIENVLKAHKNYENWFLKNGFWSV